MTETGGHYMVWTVLFVGLLAYVGNFDLAELGIDRLKFESYFEYARALAAGLQCPLRPQGMYSYSNLHVSNALSNYCCRWFQT
ncbi:hypothetical protein GQ44DRAFT_705593 [Phaeosphaeriaceae sp. PMI808]|nr:hypothetical protein GQ44DRAFT_705593 [Phaeosphaeriaceae sp. PMI808]